MRPRSYNGLLMSFLILIIVYPLVQYLEGSGWMLEVALVAVLVFAINAVTGDRVRGCEWSSSSACLRLSGGYSRQAARGVNERSSS